MQSSAAASSTRWSIDKSVFESSSSTTTIENVLDEDNQDMMSRDDLPVLELQQFSAPPTVDFGRVVYGESKRRCVRVQNLEPYVRDLRVEKFPTKRGFKVIGVHADIPGNDDDDDDDGDDESSSSFRIPAAANQYLELKWTPTAKPSSSSSSTTTTTTTNVRELVMLKMDGRFRLQITMLGVIVDKTTATNNNNNNKASKKTKQHTRARSFLSRRPPLGGGKENRSMSVTSTKPNRVNDEEENDRRFVLANKSQNVVVRQKPSKIPVLSPPKKKEQQQQQHHQSLTSRFHKKPQAGSLAQALKRASRAKAAATATSSSASAAAAAVTMATTAPVMRSQKFFDEKGPEKQQRAFTACYNSMVLMDTDDGSAIGLLEQIRVDARLRRHGCVLFHSEAVQKVLYGVDCDVSEERLKIRNDRDINNDVGVKNDIANMLFCFELRWLRVGLESVFGQIIDIPHTSAPGDAWHSAIRLFLDRHFFTSAELEEKYMAVELPTSSSSSSTAGSSEHGRLSRRGSVLCTYKEGFGDELKKHTLRRFLHVLWFLEYAHGKQLVPGAVRLFNKDAQFKCIGDMMIAFCKDYMSGMGDVLRHLHFLGCDFKFKQTELHELSFTMTNMAADLRDGVRLTRAAEVLAARQNGGVKVDYLHLLRLPASSRLRKVFNVEVALRALHAAGVPIQVSGSSAANTAGIHFPPSPAAVAASSKSSSSSMMSFTPEEIVDGARNRSHLLMWQIIHHHVVESMVDEHVLMRELARLTTIHAFRPSAASSSSLGKDSPMMGQLYMTDQRLQMLLNWCQVVCATQARRATRLFGHTVKWPVYNFTTTFCNGEILCALISFYQPALLPLASIVGLDKPKAPSSPGSTDDISQWSEFYQHTTPDDVQSVKNNKANLRQALSAISMLGGVPSLLSLNDFINTMPDEKAMVLFISYLFVRLISIQSETSAAMLIQTVWRQRKQLREARRQRQLEQAAEQRRVLRERKLREFARRLEAATAIQSVWRGYVARRTRHRLQQARALALERAERERIERLAQASAVIIQSTFRMHSCRVRFLRRLTLVREARRQLALSRMHKASQLVAREFVNEVLLTVALARVNVYLDHRAHTSAIIIQAQWRASHQRRVFTSLRDNVIRTQAVVRRWRAVERMHAVKRAVAIVDQRRAGVLAVRRARTELNRLRMQHQQRVDRERFEAARSIQTMYRRHAKRSQYVALKCAVAVIDRRRTDVLSVRSARAELYHLRVQREQRIARERFEAARLIQTAYRRHAKRSHYVALKNAALVVDSYRSSVLAVRSARAKLHHLRVQRAQQIARERFEAARLIQTAYRRHAAYTKYSALRRATAIISVRRYSVLLVRSARRQLRQLRCLRDEREATRCRAAVCIQARVRGYTARQTYARYRQAVVVLQAHIRRRQARAQYQQVRQASVTLQAYTRALCARRQRQTKLMAIVRIQAAYRCHQAQLQYAHTRRSIITAQALARRYIWRRQYQHMESAIRTLQQAVRRAALSRKIAAAVEYAGVQRQRKQAAATCIQQAYRAHQQRTQFVAYYARRVQASVKIQSYWRSVQAMRAYQQQCQAVLTIQTVIRQTLARRTYRRMLTQYKTEQYAATRIQSQWRAYQQRSVYERTRSAVIVVQSLARSMLARQYLQQRLYRVVRAQSAVRGWLARRVAQAYRARCTMAVACITNRYLALQHGRVQRRQYYAQRHAIIALQSSWRARVARRRVALLRDVRRQALQLRALQQRRAVRVISECYAAYRERQASEEKVSAVQVIQSVMRMCVQRRRVQQYRRGIVTVQAIARGRLHRRAYHHDVHALIRLQARVRGYLVRKHTAEKVKQARWRIRRAEENVTEERKIGNQTSRALEILLSSRHLSVVGDAVRTLEVVTGLLDSCCVRAVNENVVEVLLALMQSCNRSKPHLEIMRSTLNVIKNLAKSKRASVGLFEHGQLVEVMSEQMQIYRDIGDIFMKIISILREGCTHEGYAAYVKIDEATHFKRLQGILKLSQHKLAMSERYAAQSKQAKNKYRIDKACVVQLERLVATISSS